MTHPPRLVALAGLLFSLTWIACDDRPAPPAPPPPAPAAEPAPKQTVTVTSSSPQALATFQQALALSDANRLNEALPVYKKAIEQDPKFATAYAFLGNYSEGAEGLKYLQRAVELSKPLPRAEQLLILFYFQQRSGDEAASQKTLGELLSAAPDDWRALYLYGNASFNQQDWDKAVLAYSRSLERMQRCPTLTNLGYALGFQGQFSLAIHALDRCIQLSPNEPNYHDSLAELQLAADHLDEAIAEYQKATDLDPHFWWAYHGIAEVHALQGKWAAVATDMDKARAAALLPSEKVENDTLLAYLELSEGKGDQALARLKALQPKAKSLQAEAGYRLAEAAVVRSFVLSELGRYKEAVAAANEAIALSPAKGGGVALSLNRIRALVRRAWAESQLKKPEQVTKTLAELSQESAAFPKNGEVVADLHFVQGALALAHGDFSGAKAELSHCQLFPLSTFTYDYRARPEDAFCLYQLAKVDRKLGLAPEAQRVLAVLEHRPQRDPEYTYVRAVLNRGN